ncbi:MAG: hypothetical protein HeimC3_53720 [Candidatus Heimdallarchaeota archaeon LC_3]|nr:MAG: hypothetical protein HeimC3_53720 [Candidatus Heimdallarchaeota archaeon LC_3]
MRGTYHLTLSLVIGLTIYFPFMSIFSDGILSTFLSLMLILTIAWGSLIPDVDYKGHSKIFKEYPTVGNFFKYGIYKPLTIVLKEEKHRGFMHSIEGALLTVIMFLVYMLLGFIGVGIVYLVFPSIVYSILSSFESIEKMEIDVFYGIAAIITASLGLFTGIILHIFEDSLTVSGIDWRWFGENKWHRKGNVTVGGIHENTVAIGLMAEGALILFIQYSFRTDLLIQLLLTIIGIVLIAGTGFFTQTSTAGRLLLTVQGEDKKEIDVKTRDRAKENALKIILEKGLTITTDKNRIKRGLKIPKTEIDLRSKTVKEYKIIKDENNSFTCSCKDFTNTGDIVVCKHIIAYLGKKEEKYYKKLEKKIN